MSPAECRAKGEAGKGLSVCRGGEDLRRQNRQVLGYVSFLLLLLKIEKIVSSSLVR